ncbi:hypothetical protein J132_05714 [Termitomyces sp. J132]|nr:hypothetical protein C0989_008235 [Termitomyces sp. Mn162]KAH0579822.1 hypothetical protein H2248_002650 [Termitomyces sp. 'cryptogamus']KNZ71889.1 hypothetical protein J132_05714 [Termitomyces sp. J132]
MWRSLLKCFFPSKHQQARLPAGYDPVVVPAAPIFPNSRNESSSNCIHGYQRDPNDSCRYSLPERLPACGFWSPSSSYVSSSSNDLPWTVANTPDREATPPESPDDHGSSDYQISFNVVCPLKRVLAIGRREGECIRRRRKIYKIISPEELVEGLGMMFVDRSTSISFEIHEVEAVKEEQVPVRWGNAWIVVEEVDHDSDDE